MIDVLNLPLDDDFDGAHNQAQEDVMDAQQQQNFDKSRLDEDVRTVTVTSAFEETHKSNKLILAKDALQRIINIENELFRNNSDDKNEKHKDNSVMPINIDDDTIDKLKTLKEKFKSLIEDILKTRLEFHSNIDQNLNKEEGNNIVDEGDGDISEYVKTTAGQSPQGFNFLIEIKKPYYKIFLVLTIITLVAFAIMATITSSYEYSRYIGPWVVVSRGSASAILGCTAILMFFVSYDVMTLIRNH